jgi:alpha-tubulin suppressor-like RCC1 family protein
MTKPGPKSSPPIKRPLHRALPALLPLIVLAIVGVMGIAYAPLYAEVDIDGTAQVLPRPQIKIDTSKYPENYNFEVFRGETYFKFTDIKARLIATDYYDGDITNSIYIESCKRGDTTITCPTAWLDWEYGSYSITYRVTNSQGISSLPFVINVDVWQVMKITSGQWFAMALGTNGAVWTMGSNGDGQRGINSSATATNLRTPTRIPQTSFGNLAVSDIAAATNTACAITASGQAYCWGNSNYGKTADGSTGTGNSDKNAPVATQMPAGITFSQITGCHGEDATYGCGFAAIGSDGNIYTWGSGDHYRLGTGSNSDQSTPAKITAAATPFVQVSTGNNGGSAVNSAGEAYVWGSNISGEQCLGNLTTNSTNSVPHVVSGIPTIAQTSYGGYTNDISHVVFLTTGGEVYGCGERYGLTGAAGSQSTPLKIAGASNVRFINAGADFTHFVNTSNNLCGIGYTAQGELFQNSLGFTTTYTCSSMANLVNNIQMTSGGYENAWALTLNGVQIWGSGSYCTTYYLQGVSSCSGVSNTSPANWEIGINASTSTKLEW